jgi:hypothetical protein
MGEPVLGLTVTTSNLEVASLRAPFPFDSTPELAQRAAHACQYPPAGRRCGPGLAQTSACYQLQCTTEFGLMTAGAKALLEPLGIRPFAQETRALD